MAGINGQNDRRELHFPQETAATFADAQSYTLQDYYMSAIERSRYHTLPVGSPMDTWACCGCFRQQAECTEQRRMPITSSLPQAIALQQPSTSDSNLRDLRDRHHKSL
ncbi:hypothetical protein IU479_35590 [Nocardia abscessus]|uniref:hypothetical protein n=1 Tax=Nocardia TaxID=1817 RepID=UPI0018955AC7|nr:MULTISPECIES: hypothetical protein [Nocardia]MBF6223393.1 hypothetical protein [Nocardia abscessus]